MSERGLSADRLAYLTDIPKRLIVLLQEGGTGDLPSRPYVIGYLKKISSALGVSAESLIAEYNNLPRKKNGRDDLPINRFTIYSGSWKLLLVSLVVLALAAFAGYRFNDIIGLPAFKVILPPVSSSPALEISGRLLPGDSVSVNSQTINEDAEGGFSTIVSLSPGNNTFVFSVKRFLGKEATESATVYYNPSQNR